MSGWASSSDRCLGPRRLCVTNPLVNPAIWGGGHRWPTRWRNENCLPSGGGSGSQGKGYLWRWLGWFSTAPCWVRRHGLPGSLERAFQQRWNKRGANVVFTWVFSWNVWDELHGFLPGREIFEQVDRQCIFDHGVPLYKRYLPSGLLLYWSRWSRNCLPKWKIQQQNGANNTVDVPKLLSWHSSPVGRVHKVHDMPERRVLPENDIESIMPSWKIQRPSKADSTVGVPELLPGHCSPVIWVHGVHIMPERRVLSKRGIESIMP